MPRKHKKSTKKLRFLSLKISTGWLLVPLLMMCGSVYAATGMLNSQTNTAGKSGEPTVITENQPAQESADESSSSKKTQKTEPAEPPATPSQSNSVKPVAPSKPYSVPNPPAPSPTPSPAPSSPSSPIVLETASSLQFINSVRQSAGKPSLQQNSIMDQWALSHAKKMAVSCDIYHQNISGFLGQDIGPINISSVAENVGFANTTSEVLEGLKNSPGHYANMTGDYSYAGLGVVKAATGGCQGYVYTTQLFAK